MKKFIPLVAFAAFLFTLFACSADGAMQSKSDDSGKDDKNIVRDEENDDDDVFVKDKDDSECFVVKDESTVYINLGYMSLTIEDMDAFASVTMHYDDDDEMDLEHFCETELQELMAEDLECDADEHTITSKEYYSGKDNFETVVKFYKAFCD